jgi:DNA-binding transcriptional regulator YiaG
MKKYYSEACEVMHHDAMAEYELGLISEARMKEYDEMCFVKEGEPGYEETPVKKGQVAALL